MTDSCSKLHFPGVELRTRVGKGFLLAPQKDSGRTGTMSRPPGSVLLNISSRNVASIYLLSTLCMLSALTASGKAGEVRGPGPRAEC